MDEPDVRQLDPLEGEWETEATHPRFDGGAVPGRTTFEWLEGGHFLIGRSRNEHPLFPDGLVVLGRDGDALSMRYFDSRGVVRTYGVEVAGRVWRMWRDDPEFAQRFEGTISEDGDVVDGQWKLCQDGESWNDDLRITYRRVR